MSKMVNCKACGNEIAKGAKNCPNCGKDQRNFFMRHKITTFILVIFIIVILAAVTRDNSSDSTSSDSTSVDEAISIDDYKAQCESIAYDDIAREPDKYKNLKLKFTGEVIQVEDNGSDIMVRVNVTKGEFDIYEDTILVNYTYSDNEKKLLEGDIVDIWGESKGITSYTSVLGSKVTIPEIDAKYIEIVGKTEQ